MTFRPAYLVLLCFISAHRSHAAENLGEAFNEGSTSGNIRAYYFTKDVSMSAPQLNDQRAFSVGGKLHFETQPLYGASGGVSFYTANGLGLEPDNPKEVDVSLPGRTINVLGEAYFQYTSKKINFSIGRQELTTPFAHQSDARIIPVTFESAIFNYKLPKLTVGVGHLTKIKDRVSDTFVNTGLYATSLYKVPSQADTSGTPFISAVYDDGHFKAQAWNYYLLDLFNLAFLQADYVFQPRGISPFVSVQYVREREVGSSLLGKVDSTAYGVLVGIKKGQTGLTAGFNSIPYQSGAFRNGGILSPYTYATDPLYTTSVTAGLVEKSSAFVGNSYKIGGSYALNGWLLLASYAKYDIDANLGGKDSSETDIDLTYTFSGRLKGLSARNRVCIVNSQLDTEKLVYNRLQLQYMF